ncbi:MAG: hypothetical protein U0T68_05655 [Ferruginibacter sp.]
MNQETNTNALNEFDKSQLPSSINVLTILTIIGSSLGILSSAWNYISAKKSYEDLKEVMNNGKLDEAPKFVRGMMTPQMLEMSRKAYENRLPMLILGLVAMSLCLYGAIEMRKLKKQGYTFWLIGEVLPVFSTIFFIGTAAFGGFGLIMWMFPIIFIILYTVNRKHLIY